MGTGLGRGSTLGSGLGSGTGGGYLGMGSGVEALGRRVPVKAKILKDDVASTMSFVARMRFIVNMVMML